MDYTHAHDNDSDDDEDEDYDLPPSKHELNIYGDMSDDELDSLQGPRIQELFSDGEDTPKKSDTKKDKKSKKRTAEETPEKPTGADNKKGQQHKKLKTNDGKSDAAAPAKKEDKKVKFSKKLEQGPTGSPAIKNETSDKKDQKKSDKKEAEKKDDKKATSEPRKVNGVLIEDKVVGSGPTAKSGKTVKMRYIGKLTNGKTFDSNTKGKPFSFTLGKGEVIKGWDIGIAGMMPGGERRITIPGELAYGKKGMPGIPPNATLIFEVKLMSLK